MMQLAHTTTAPWERNLLNLAYEAFQGGTGTNQFAAQWDTRSSAALDSAYRYCSNLTEEHSRSFFLASAFLPPQKRRAMHALYAFCRIADDIVDHPGEDPQNALEAWSRMALAATSQSQDPVAAAWADTRMRYQIPYRLAEHLLDGIGQDIHTTRYQTFEELATYAYGVASTVGLMSMHITGFRGRQAIPYAIKLGVALQVTNILRDVGEDLQAGRVYLPEEELANFGISHDNLVEGRVDEQWRNFMRFQIQRNRCLYSEAWPGIAMLHPDGRMAIAAAAEFYAAILNDIEAHDYDVFNRRAHIGAWGKLRRLPGLYLKLHWPEDSSNGRVPGLIL
ncbi:MAG: phytoene/squalene synthase family protein [Chloroflexi bacterium]|nr:MAG: phytoene/squalene synthase family protein [Chloroflexota bacterium]